MWRSSPRARGYRSSVLTSRPRFDRLEERALLTTPTVTSLSASAASLPFRQSEVLRATVTTDPPGPTTPTGGTVSFFDGPNALGNSPLVNGVATLDTSALGIGVRGLTAVYNGDGDHFSASRPDPARSVIATVAGNGDFSNRGDGGPAIGPAFYYPHGVALDAAGDLFIADTDNETVRRVDHATGVITTLPGFSHGAFGFISGVAADAAGDVFFVDDLHKRVFRADHATGSITLVAGDGTYGHSGDGGPAVDAEIAVNGSNVAVDAAGDVYIAESNVTRQFEPGWVRRVDHATGIITTVAGDGVPGDSGDGGPAVDASVVVAGVAVDAAGDVFIAGDTRVRRVDHSTGVITTVAGDGTRGFSGDGGPATAASIGATGVAVDAFGNLFIADAILSRVRRVDHVTGVITTFAGSAIAGLGGDGGPANQARLNSPAGIAADGAGNLYIADTGNNRIREVSPVIVTVTPVAPDVTPVPVTATSGVASTATYATFTTTDTRATPADFTAVLDYGDFNPGPGVISVGADHVFTVRATHTYPYPGVYHVVVTLSYPGDNLYVVAPSVVSTPPVTTPPPAVVLLQRLGIHAQPTRLVLTFDRPMNPATVQDLRNYALAKVGPHGNARRFAPPIPIISAVYDPVHQTVTLAPRSRLALHGDYALTVNGTGPHPVRDLSGNPLTGTGTGGQPVNYIAIVHGYGPWAGKTPAPRARVATAWPAGPQSVPRPTARPRG